jgi:hypothetical protein
MAISNIAMEPRTVVDTQYAVHAAYDAANDAANNRSHGASIVLTDASAMSRAIRYALSVCSSRHCKRHGADEYDVSNHVYLLFWGERSHQRAGTACVPLYDCEISKGKSANGSAQSAAR